MALDLGNISDYLNQSGGGADVGSGLDFSSLGQINPYTFALQKLMDLGLSLGQGDWGGAIGDIFPLGGDIFDFANGDFGKGIGDLLGGPLGGMLGGLLQGLFSGVPKGAKTSGAAETLEKSGNPLSADLGQYISKIGGGKDSNVLSNPQFAHQVNNFANLVTWLSGQALPGWKPMGTTGEISGIKPPSGAPYGKPVNIMGIESPDQLAGILGKSPDLSPAQIQAILLRLMDLAKNGQSIASLKGALGPLVTDASRATADTQAYMNQGGGIPFPGLNSEGGGQGGGSQLNPMTILPLLNFLNFGGNNNNNGDQPNNNPQQNDPLMSLFGGGASVGYPTVAFPR